MAAYNPPDQILFSPVTNYYQGKALRADTALREKQAEALQAELDAAPAAAKAAARKEQRAEEKLQLEQQKEERIAQAAEAKRIVQGAYADTATYKSLLESDGQEAASAWIGEKWKGLYDMMEGDSPEKRQFGQMLQDGITPQEVEAARNEFGAVLGQFEDEAKGSQTKFIGDDGKAHVGTFRDGVYTDANGVRHYKAKPVSEVATQEELSGPSGDKVLDREIVKAEQSTRNLVDLIDRVDSQIDAVPQAGLGLTGMGLRGINEIGAELSGIYELLGGSDIIDDEEVRPGSLMDPSLYDFPEDMAGASAAIKSNYVTLAYLKARALDPAGRLAKDDVALAMQSLGGDWAQKSKMKIALRETKWQALNGLKNYYKTIRRPEKFPVDLENELKSIGSGVYKDEGDKITYDDGTTVVFE
jgi:hypothetical protein